MSDKGLDKGVVEFKGRTDEESTDVAVSEIVELLKAKVS